MKRRLIYIIILVLLAFGLVTYFFIAGNNNEKQIKNPELNWTKKNSTDLGKELAIQEELDIKIFLEGQKDWIMIRTGSGLRYMITSAGTGDSIRTGDVAEIEYKITQLDGTLLVQTEEDEYEEFEVDKSEIETGIQEGIKYLRVGDKARFIIPSHLGHGLVGDMDKIPPLTTLVVELNVLGKKI